MAIRLMARDRRLLKAVNDCQALQVGHVRTLLFNSASPTYGRLKKLADHGYLERHYITQVAAAPAASPMVFTISKLGAEVLAATYGYDSDDFNFAGRGVLNWKNLQHILATNDVRVATTRACEDTPGFELLEWRNEALFRAQTDYVYITNRNGRRVKKPVYPDGYCVLATPKGQAHCFVEVDRGTEGLSQFGGQISIYQEYMLSGLYQERFQTSSLRILVVTTTVKRMDNLRRATAKAGGKDRYWFSTFAQVTPAAVLSQPIWRKTQGEGWYAFV